MLYTPADPEGNVQPGTQAIRKVISERYDGIQEYLLYRPTNRGDTSKLPVLLFLHGRGEGRLNRGEYQGINAVKQHNSPPALCESSEWSYPFIIISPQLPDEMSRWHQPRHAEVVNDIISNIVNWYQGDENRIYATGFSIGGLGIVAIAAQYRQGFAALLPVDAYDPSPSWENRTITSKFLISIPIWSHHSVKNCVAPVVIRLINNNPLEETYAVNYSHVNICRRAYANSEIYRWLLDH